MGDRTRENRLRRMAARQGLALSKSRTRDPYATDYGLYRLIGEHGDVLGLQDAYTATLDQVEAYLKGDRP